MSRGWLYASIAFGLCFGLLFAAYPSWDLALAEWFFDPVKERFPLATGGWSNAIREFANWIPWILVLPALLALVCKLAYPGTRMLLAPSVVLYLLASLVIGPGLVSNVLLKEGWGRPRPNHVEQFAGTASFEPWWRPGGSCQRNCSFVSGEASQAFWTVAAASLAPPQVRPVALAAAVTFGGAVGSLRVAFGRHFLTDVVFAGVLTVLVIFVLYGLLLDPLRRNDARLERAIERTAIALHKGIGATLAGTGNGLAAAGMALRDTGQYLHKRAACL